MEPQTVETFALVIACCVMSFLIGAVVMWSIQIYRFYRRLALIQNEYACSVAQLRQEIDGWERWYSDHMPECATFSEQNRIGTIILNEYEGEYTVCESSPLSLVS